jgi:phosphatidylglycerophosphate synthase
MTEQHPVLAKVPTALSGFRLAYGTLQIGKILQSSPRERTWNDAIKTGCIAITDKLDGDWSRHFGSTKNGSIIDRLADIAFSVGGEVALAVNDEISPIHPLLSIGREATVNTLRKYAEKSGRTIPVGNRGRQKTALKMAMLTAARSPLSRHLLLVVLSMPKNITQEKSTIVLPQPVTVNFVKLQLHPTKKLSVGWTINFQILHLTI